MYINPTTLYLEINRLIIFLSVLYEYRKKYIDDFLNYTIILFIIWNIRRQSPVENFSDNGYDDDYQSVTKTYIKGIKYKRNINLVLHPNELFKTINLPYLFQNLLN